MYCLLKYSEAVFPVLIFLFTVLTKLNSGVKINEQVLSKPKKAAGVG